MKLIPLSGYAIIKPEEASNQTNSGIILTETEEKTQFGEILAIEGESKAKAGDRVVFGKYAGEEIGLEGDKYLIVEITSIRAVVEG
jgi:chaperonin GroES